MASVLDRIKRRIFGAEPIDVTKNLSRQIQASPRARATLPQTQALIQQAKKARGGGNLALSALTAPKDLAEGVANFGIDTAREIGPRTVLRLGLEGQNLARRMKGLPELTDASSLLGRHRDKFNLALGADPVRPVGKDEEELLTAFGADPEKAATIGRVGGFGLLALDATGIGKAKRLANPVLRKAAQATAKARKADVVGPSVNKARNLISQVPDTPDPKQLNLTGIGETPLKERGFIKNVKESKQTVPDVADRISGFYEPVTDRKSIAEAQEAISNRGLSAVTADIFKAKNTTPLHDMRRLNVEGIEAARELQNQGLKLKQAGKTALADQKFDEAAGVIEHLAKIGTEAGQIVESFRLWGRLTPQGMLKYADRLVAQANNRKFFQRSLKEIITDPKGKNKITLTPDDKRAIQELMTKAEKVSGPEKDKLVKEALKVIDRKIPLGANELLDAYRYTNMLSNPLTQLRNMYSNFFQALLTRPGTIAVSSGIDFLKAMSKGEGTKAVKQLTQMPVYYKGLFNSWGTASGAFMDVMRGVEDVAKPDIQQLRTAKLPRFLRIFPTGMEAGDRFMSTLISSGEYQRLIRQGVPKKQAAETAREIAEYSLFRQASNVKGQGWMLDNIDRAIQWVEQGRRKVPGLKWFVPFIRTPMNFAKQWIEFSPVGLANLPGAARKQEQIAKAIMGSTAMSIGGAFALQGQSTWIAPSDPKQKELFYATGRKPFSIKVGDAWVPMMYFGPFALSFALPAAIKYYQDEQPEALTDDQVTKISKILMSSVEFWSQQTFTSGLMGWMRMASGDIDFDTSTNLAHTSGQLIPFDGMVGYVTRLLDPVYRKVPSGTFSERFADAVRRDLPFFSNDLPAHTNPLQEEAMRNMSNYIAPFSMGLTDNRFEDLLQGRTKRLQNNAQERQLKRQLEDQVAAAESGKILEDKYFWNDVEVGTVKTIDLSKFKEEPESKPGQVKFRKEQFQKAKEIFNNDQIPEEDKAVLFGKIGVDPEDVEYYDIASETNDVKLAFIQELIEEVGVNNAIDTIAPLRRKVAGKHILANGVIDDLKEQGIISKEEAKLLKRTSIDSSGKTVLTGGGNSAKKLNLPNITIKKANVPRITQSGRAGGAPRFKTPRVNISSNRSVGRPREFSPVTPSEARRLLQQ